MLMITIRINIKGMWFVMVMFRWKVFFCMTGSVLSFAVQAKTMVYSPKVSEGEFETAYYVDAYRGPGDRFANTQELEFEYGLTRNDKAALYLVGGHRPGDVSEAAWQIEWIHDLGGTASLNGLGVYVEYRQARNAVDKIELKPLYETWFSDRALRMRLNAELERGIGGGADNGIEVGYAAGLALARDKTWVPALEFFGTLGEIGNIQSLDDQSHLGGAALDVRLTQDLKWHIGGLFGLTSGSEDWRVKSQLSLEW